VFDSDAFDVLAFSDAAFLFEGVVEPPPEEGGAVGVGGHGILQRYREYKRQPPPFLSGEAVKQWYEADRREREALARVDDEEALIVILANLDL
jgi:hypothetical protein